MPCPLGVCAGRAGQEASRGGGGCWAAGEHSGAWWIRRLQRGLLSGSWLGAGAGHPWYAHRRPREVLGSLCMCYCLHVEEENLLHGAVGVRTEEWSMGCPVMVFELSSGGCRKLRQSMGPRRPGHGGSAAGALRLRVHRILHSGSALLPLVPPTSSSSVLRSCGARVPFSPAANPRG